MFFLAPERIHSKCRRFCGCLEKWGGVLLVVFCLSVLHLIPANAYRGEAGVWIGPDGTALPFRDYDEIEEFLSAAKILEVEEIPVGITKPVKMMMERDGVRMNAIFRNVEVFKHREESRKGLRFNFRDSCLFECAAYRLSRMLGLKNVPPVVRRELRREDFEKSEDYFRLEYRKGSLQAWVENAFTEKDRQEKSLRPPDYRNWAQQHRMMKVFDNLIFNDDRNQTNILIGPDWKIWFIDSTRAFRPLDDLPDPDDLVGCDRGAWEKLVQLNDELLDEQLGDLLMGGELRALKKRRQKLIERVGQEIDRRGKDAVLFDLPQAVTPGAP